MMFEVKKTSNAPQSVPKIAIGMSHTRFSNIRSKCRLSVFGAYHKNTIFIPSSAYLESQNVYMSGSFLIAKRIGDSIEKTHLSAYLTQYSIVLMKLMKCFNSTSQ